MPPASFARSAGRPPLRAIASSARAIASYRPNPEEETARTKAPYERVEAAGKNPWRRGVHRARQTATGRRNEFFHPRLHGDRNPRGSCNSPASRAGSCPRARLRAARRTQPATQMGPFFEQTYAVAGFSQRDGRGESCQAAADHDHALRGHCVGSTSPAARAGGYLSFQVCSAERARRKHRSRALRSAATAAINSRQRPERGARVGVHFWYQFHAFPVKVQGASGFERE